MKFTQIPTTAMEEMQLNAGVLLSSFTPSTAEVSGIIGATPAASSSPPLPHTATSETTSTTAPRT